MAIRVAPTLEIMARMYRLSRAGGPNSPRFQFYLAHVERQWGLVAYNPMAGATASEAVERLIDLEAEALAFAAATSTAAACEFGDDMTLAVVVRAQGLWTDRIATEIEQCVSAVRRDAHGLVDMWAGESFDGNDVRRESAAEAARVVWTVVNGQPRSLRCILEREGFAYAVAKLTTGVDPRFGKVVTSFESSAVDAAVDLLGDSEEHSDIAGVLFGDPASAALGWTPPGVPAHAGYRWAIARAIQAINERGLGSVLRQTPNI